MINVHMVIRAIVYAKTRDGALDKAKAIFDGLIERGTFDYYTTFDDTTTKSSGRARWGRLPTCIKADNRKGKELIEQGMKFTKEEFMRNIKEVRKALNEETNERLFERKTNDYFFKSRCHWIGMYEGSTIWLYDDNGCGIKDDEHLKNALSKWKCLNENKGKESPYKDLDVWVCPADVHY